MNTFLDRSMKEFNIYQNTVTRFIVTSLVGLFIIKKRTPDTGSEPSTSMPKAPAKTAAGKKPLSAFEKAFAKARAEGKPTFPFNGKQYTTKYKGE